MIVHKSEYPAKGWIHKDKESPPVGEWVDVIDVSIVDWNMEVIIGEGTARLNNGGHWTIRPKDKNAKPFSFEVTYWRPIKMR